IGVHADAHINVLDEPAIVAALPVGLEGRKHTDVEIRNLAEEWDLPGAAGKDGGVAEWEHLLGVGIADRLMTVRQIAAPPADHGQSFYEAIVSEFGGTRDHSLAGLLAIAIVRPFTVERQVDDRPSVFGAHVNWRLAALLQCIEHREKLSLALRHAEA